ncbi:MAG: hypothetical protein BGO49_26850 [Planctomycetales bacterium 71-10]|nr:MAG: hypothetical protein BGO49_26850 [Planctomycetales bacterium 71-10]
MSRSRVASPVERLFERGTWTGADDARLLERYARRGDREAFEALAARHGPMVLGVCRRILIEPSDVDDAFQATFLVLIRRARSLGPGDVLAAWLHGVATKVARRARMDRARRRARERDGLAVEPGCEPDSPDFALRGVIDEEVERLPWRYRAPVALCYLEGLTHEEAAARLGWPVGSVKGRLARARSMLGPRLARRGVTAGAGALALENLASAAVPAPLVDAVATAAGRVAEGVAWKSVLSYPVVRLAKGACGAMIATKLTAALTATALVAAAGAGFAAARPEGQEPPADSQPAEPPRQSPGQEAAEDPAEVQRGASGPAGGAPSQPAASATPAVAGAPGPAAKPDESPSEAQAGRLLAASTKAYRSAVEELRRDYRAIDRVYRASRLWLDAQQALATDEQARKDAFAEHRARMSVLARIPFPSVAPGDASLPSGADAGAMLAEAELWATRGDAPPRPGDPSGPGTSDGPGDSNPKTAQILAKLDEPLPMNFPNDTPLEDVLKYIKQVVGDAIPVYVEPIGLNQADKTITSPISIDLDGVPLRRTLQLALKQLGLVYYVEDGILVITSPEGAEGGMGAERARPSRRLEEIEKAERGELTLEEMQDLAQKLKLIDEIRKAVKALDDPPPVGGTGGGFQ